MALLIPTIGLADELGEVDLTILDAESQEPIAARLRIEDSRGRAPRIRQVPRLGNDFTFRNLLSFKLRTGRYQFTVHRGPHYRPRIGHLEVKRDGFDQKTLTLPRFVDVRAEGYVSGDLLVTRDREELEVLMDAEELDFLATPTWSPGEAFSKISAQLDRSVHVDPVMIDYSAAVSETDGGRYLVANYTTDIQPTTVPSDAYGFASTVKRHPSARVVALDPWAWDLPLLVAHELVDAVVVWGDHLQLEGDRNGVDRGRKPQLPRFQHEQAAGRYAESIYFHLLNSGHRLAPACFSNSGKTKNPPGYNRVYVACGQDFRPETWWENLVAGRSLISNGPVLRVRANERLPGTVFRDAAEVRLEVTCDLATRQKIDYLELIKNGRVFESVRLDKWAAAGGHLPIVPFRQSGWLAVRAYSASEPNFRCALSAPFYVEIGDQPRISKASAEFFQDWVLQRAKQLRRSDLSIEIMKTRIQQQKQAYDYWSDLVAKATD